MRKCRNYLSLKKSLIKVEASYDLDCGPIEERQLKLEISLVLFEASKQQK